MAETVTPDMQVGDVYVHDNADDDLAALYSMPEYGRTRGQFEVLAVSVDTVTVHYHMEWRDERDPDPKHVSVVDDVFDWPLVAADMVKGYEWTKVK